MVIRVFRPTIHPGKENEFERFLRDTALPLVSQQPGLVACMELSGGSLGCDEDDRANPGRELDAGPGRR